MVRGLVPGCRTPSENLLMTVSEFYIFKISTLVVRGFSVHIAKLETVFVQKAGEQRRAASVHAKDNNRIASEAVQNLIPLMSRRLGSVSKSTRYLLI